MTKKEFIEKMKDIPDDSVVIEMLNHELDIILACNDLAKASGK